MKRTIAVAVVAFFVSFGAASGQGGRDVAQCAVEQHASVQTEAAMDATIAACSRLLEDAGTPPEGRALALYVRGLNRFLIAVVRAVNARQPLVSGSPALAPLIDPALEDLAASAASVGTAPEIAAQAFALRATIFTTLGRDDEALSEIGEALRVGWTPTFLVQRALLWERRDRFGEAIADLDAAIAADPKIQTAWLNRGRLWARFGDLDRAVADFDQSAATGGAQTWVALSEQAKCWVRLGEPRRAYPSLTRAAALAPIPLLAAQLHVRAGNLARDYLKDADAMETSYRAALDVIADYPDAYIQRGLGYERAARFADAQAEYARAIASTCRVPNDPTCRYARFRAEKLRDWMARRAGDGAIPSNVAVLSRPAAARSGAGRVALVLGNAGYRHVTPLPNADRDAETVGQALSETGFTRVTVATDVDKAQMESLLQQFFEETREADWALVYFAGHGFEVEGRNYLVPVDASIETLRDAGGAVPLSGMLRSIGAARRLRVVALDACRDNPFVQEARRVAALNRGMPSGPDARIADERPAIGGGLARVELTGANTMVFFSTQPGHVALDGDDLNSPFTRAFVRNIPVPGLALEAFFSRVTEDVVQATERRQQPALLGRLDRAETYSFLPADRPR